jgi:hypothetical protein
LLASNTAVLARRSVTLMGRHLEDLGGLSH